jgi:hypothetical protein
MLLFSPLSTAPFLYFGNSRRQNLCARASLKHTFLFSPLCWLPKPHPKRPWSMVWEGPCATGSFVRSKVSVQFYIKLVKLSKRSIQWFAPGFVCCAILVFAMVCVLLCLRSYVGCGTKSTRRNFVNQVMVFWTAYLCILGEITQT